MPTCATSTWEKPCSLGQISPAPIRARTYQPAGEPPVGFRPVPATLEDAYLITMQEADEVEPLAPRRLPGPPAAGGSADRAAQVVGR